MNSPQTQGRHPSPRMPASGQEEPPWIKPLVCKHRTQQCRWGSSGHQHLRQEQQTGAERLTGEISSSPRRLFPC